jgi:hypothetical protein
LRKNKAHALASTTTSNQKKSRRFALTELTRGGAIQTVTGSGLLASKPAEVVVARMERLDLQKSLALFDAGLIEDSRHTLSFNASAWEPP